MIGYVVGTFSLLRYPSLLLGLEVVEEDGALLRLLTPVLDDDARAVDDLASVTLTVDLAYHYTLVLPPLHRNVKIKTYKDQPTLQAAFHLEP